MEGCAGVVILCTVLCLSASIYIYSYIYRGISLSLKELGTFLRPCPGAIVMALLTASAAACCRFSCLTRSSSAASPGARSGGFFLLLRLVVLIQLPACSEYLKSAREPLSGYTRWMMSVGSHSGMSAKSCVALSLFRCHPGPVWGSPVNG